MVRTKGPLMSEDARGAVGKANIFSMRRGTSYVKKMVKPKNPKTVGQVGARGFIRFAVAAWQALTGEEKSVYSLVARGKPYSGYNFFIAEYVRQMVALSLRTVYEQEWQIGEGPDDGYEEAETYWYDDYDFLFAGRDSLGTYAAGVLFRNIAISQGAEILEVRLRVYSNTSGLEGTELTVWGVDEDNCGAWGQLSRPSGRVKTEANVLWVPFNWTWGEWIESPNIKAIIQELVNRAGWVSGNKVGIIVWTVQPSGDYAVAFRSREYNPAYAAKLYVKWKE